MTVYTVSVINYTGQDLMAKSIAGVQTIPASSPGDEDYSFNIDNSGSDKRAPGAVVFHSERGTRTVKLPNLKVYSTWTDGVDSRIYTVVIAVGYIVNGQKMLVDANQNPVTFDDDRTNTVYLTSRDEKVTFIGSKIKAIVDDVVGVFETIIGNHFKSNINYTMLIFVVLIIAAVIIGILFVVMKNKTS